MGAVAVPRGEPRVGGRVSLIEEEMRERWKRK